MAVVDTLARHKALMERWWSTLPQQRYPKPFKGRWETFVKVLNDFAARPADHKIIIVELGTSRSFVDGAFPGCNSDDTSFWNPNDNARWDYGAGLFTYIFAEFMTANHPNFELHTIDLCAEHIARCKHMTRPFEKNLRYYVCDSVQFLSTFRTKCDLIYMDTGDMTPIEPTAHLQINEARVIVDEKLVNTGGYILIDDVRHPAALDQDARNFYGKAKYSIPFLVSRGFRVVSDEYQVLLSAVQ